eukprot:SAG31_NODE_217_length_19988_cov_53.300820_9_plen_178_part_00
MWPIPSLLKILGRCCCESACWQNRSMLPFRFFSCWSEPPIGRDCTADCRSMRPSVNATVIGRRRHAATVSAHQRPAVPRCDSAAPSLSAELDCTGSANVPHDISCKSAPSFGPWWCPFQLALTRAPGAHRAYCTKLVSLLNLDRSKFRSTTDFIVRLCLSSTVAYLPACTAAPVYCG